MPRSAYGPRHNPIESAATMDGRVRRTPTWADSKAAVVVFANATDAADLRDRLDQLDLTKAAVELLDNLVEVALQALEEIRREQ